MASAVRGNDCLFKVNLTGGLKQILCSKSFSINTTAEFVETTTITDGTDASEGIWKDFSYDSLSYTITLEGVMKITDNTDDTGWTLTDAMTSFLEVPYTIIYKDPENNTKTITGNCLIRSINFSATPNALVQQNFEFIGKGKYTIS
jgi:hypothetical protein